MRIFDRFIASAVHTGHALIAAFQFLSRIPIPVSVPFNEAVCRRSLLFFPLVGWTLGWLLLLSAWLGSLWFPPVVSAVVVLWIWIAFSGGLHLDGWMDTADGIMSHRSRERMLEIMRDSRVGAMGAAAAVLGLLLKAAVLFAMLEEGIHIFAFYLVMIPALSRLFMVWAIYLWPYVRDGGIGSLYQKTKFRHAGGAVVVTLVCAALLNVMLSTPWQTLIFSGLILFAATFIGGSVLALFLTRKLGGLTGDTYGFINEAIEMLLLLAAWVAAMHLLP